MTTESHSLKGRAQEITLRLHAILADVLKLDASAPPISNDSNLYELGLESLSVVALLSSIESAFGFTIDVEDLSTELFDKFGNLVAFVQGKSDERT